MNCLKCDQKFTDPQVLSCIYDDVTELECKGCGEWHLVDLNLRLTSFPPDPGDVTKEDIQDCGEAAVNLTKSLIPHFDTWLTGVSATGTALFVGYKKKKQKNEAILVLQHYVGEDNTYEGFPVHIQCTGDTIPLERGLNHREL